MDPEDLIAMAAQIGARIEHVGDHAVLTTRDGQRLTVAYPPGTTYPYGPTAAERREGARAESMARDDAHIVATAPPPPPPTPGRYGSQVLAALAHGSMRGYVPRGGPPPAAGSYDYAGRSAPATAPAFASVAPGPVRHGLGASVRDPIAERRQTMAAAPAPVAPSPPPAAAPAPAPAMTPEMLAAARARRR